MRLPSNEVEWSLFLPFLKLDPKSRRVVAGISARTDEADDAFIETETGLLPLAELKRELAALSGNRETVRSGLAKSVASGALHSSPGEPAKAWWVSARIENPDLWQEIRTGRMTGFQLRGRAQRSTIKRDVSDEPRLPAGQPGGGQWTSIGSTGAPTPAPMGSEGSAGTQTSAPTSSESTAAAAISGTTAAVGSIISSGAGISGETVADDAVIFNATRAMQILARLGPLALKGLTFILERSAAAFAAFDIIFIPRNENTVGNGSIPIPGLAAVTYRYDQEAGQLELRQSGKLVATGHVDAEGFFRDEQGVIIAREIIANNVSAGVIADEESIKNYVEARSGKRSATGAEAVPLARTGVDRPKTQECPLPVPDRPGSDSSLDGVIYQSYVSSRLNPGDPIPLGMAVRRETKLASDGWVYYDDCQKQTGILVEAKSWKYRDLLFSGNEFLHDQVLFKLIDQAERQVDGADDIPIVWYFEDKATAEYVKDVFAGLEGLEKIDVEYLEMPKEYREWWLKEHGLSKSASFVENWYERFLGRRFGYRPWLQPTTRAASDEFVRGNRRWH